MVDAECTNDDLADGEATSCFPNPSDTCARDAGATQGDAGCCVCACEVSEEQCSTLCFPGNEVARDLPCDTVCQSHPFADCTYVGSGGIVGGDTSACEAATSCAECTSANLGCAWCEDTKSCSAAGWSASETPPCAVPSLFDFMCPSTVTSCGDHRDCGRCMRDVHNGCANCAPTGMCSIVTLCGGSTIDEDDCKSATFEPVESVCSRLEHATCFESNCTAAAVAAPSACEGSECAEGEVTPDVSPLCQCLAGFLGCFESQSGCAAATDNTAGPGRDARGDALLEQCMSLGCGEEDCIAALGFAPPPVPPPPPPFTEEDALILASWAVPLLCCICVCTRLVRRNVEPGHCCTALPKQEDPYERHKSFRGAVPGSSGGKLARTLSRGGSSRREVTVVPSPVKPTQAAADLPWPPPPPPPGDLATTAADDDVAADSSPEADTSASPRAADVAGGSLIAAAGADGDVESDTAASAAAADAVDASEASVPFRPAVFGSGTLSMWEYVSGYGGDGGNSAVGAGAEESPYYYNHDTGESAWDPPEGFVADTGTPGELHYE